MFNKGTLRMCVINKGTAGITRMFTVNSCAWEINSIDGQLIILPKTADTNTWKFFFKKWFILWHSLAGVEDSPLPPYLPLFSILSLGAFQVEVHDTAIEVSANIVAAYVLFHCEFILIHEDSKEFKLKEKQNIMVLIVVSKNLSYRLWLLQIHLLTLDMIIFSSKKCNLVFSFLSALPSADTVLSWLNFF